MTAPLVSVIIPVYKVEKYLEACIQSVLEQNYNAIEIILIDDGSPDTCPEICDFYAEKYKNIHVIHKKNQGVGLARKTGVESSVGTYLLFLDSDDRLDGTNAIRCMVDEAEKKNADIVTGGFRRFDDTGTGKASLPRLKSGSYSRTVDFRYKGFYLYGHLSFFWGKLYRRSFLEKHNISFISYPYMEDRAFNMRCCACEPVYSFVEESVILYRINNDSVTFQYKEKLLENWMKLGDEFEQFLQERKIKKDYHDLTAFHVFYGTFSLVMQEIGPGGRGKKAAAGQLRIYGKNTLVRQMIHAFLRGRYLNKIEPLGWKAAIWCACVLFNLHAYYLFALVIQLLCNAGVYGKIVTSRYQE